MLDRESLDLLAARAASPEEKARQTFAAMRFGLTLKRAQLRTRHPDETDEAIEARVIAWLAEEE